MRGQKRDFRVGLIGESPNDTAALLALLNQRYGGQFVGVAMAKGLTGDRLKIPKMRRVLQTEYDLKRPNLVVYIRDLDALASDAAQVARRQAEFQDIQKVVGGDALFLLHIYQFEALLLADVVTFNRVYHVAVPAPGNPTRVIAPKKKLMAATDKPKAARQYGPNDSAELAAQLDYARLLAKCPYFREFDAAFAARLGR